MTDTGQTDPGREEETNRHAWLAPVAIGLVVGLVVAIVAVVLTRDDADAPVATDPDVTTTVASDTTLAEDSDPSTTVATETTVAPETTLAPETTAGTAAPDSTAAPTPPGDAFPVASPGTVLLQGDEFPIVRVCASTPVTAYQLTSYLFFDASGFPEIVEVGQDEGSPPFGTYRGDGEVITDLGDNGFGFNFFEGDGPGTPISVNPTSFGDSCPGSVELTDPTNPDFPTSYLIVDVCFGTHQPNGALGYRARLQDGGEFTADPNAGSSFAVTYSGSTFGADDPAAASVGADDTMIEGVLVGNPNGSYAGQSRNFTATIIESQVRSCTDVD